MTKGAPREPVAPQGPEDQVAFPPEHTGLLLSRPWHPPMSSSSAPPFQLRLFGSPTLHRGERKVPLSAMQLALLSLVYGSDGEEVTRGRIAWMLWQEDLHSKVRHRISQLIYSASRKLGGVSPVETRGDELAAAPRVECDLSVFRRLDSLESLRVASERLTLGFVQLDETGLGNDFLDWRDARTLSLRKQVREAAARMWTDAESRCDWSSARAAVEVLLGLDPRNEQFLRALMRARALAGQPEEAEIAFASFREGAEAGWTPESSTVELLQAIRTGIRTRSPIRSAPFVGRDKEMAQLRGAITAPDGSAPVTFLISGEAGIGKSRLLEEASKVLALEGYRVQAVGCGVFEKDIALNVIAEILADPSYGRTVAKLEPPWRRLLEEVRDPGVNAGMASTISYDGSASRRLMEAIRAALTLHSKEAPLALLIDDIQWIDPTSLLALQYMLRRWEGERLLFAATVRTEELYTNTAAAKFAAHLSVESDAWIQLHELEDDAASELVEALTDAPLEHRRRLLSLGDNSPFFLTELAIQYQREGAAAIEATEDQVSVPTSIQGMVCSRMRGVSAIARRVLDVAALGPELSIGEMAALIGVTAQAISEAVSELVTAELLAPSHTLHIKHELLRTAVAQMIDGPQRARIHHDIGELLLERPQPPVGEAALHFHAAGNRDRAFHLAKTAVSAAAGKGATAEAVTFCKIALEDAPDLRSTADAAFQLAHLHQQAYDIPSAISVSCLAEDLLRGQGEFERAAACAVLRIEAQSEQGVLDHRQCVLLLDPVIERLREEGSWLLYFQSMEKKLRILERMGDLPAIRRALDEIRCFGSRGDQRAQSVASSVLSLDLLFGKGTNAVEDARRAVVLAKRTDDLELIAKAYSRCLFILIFAGRLNLPDDLEVIQSCRQLSNDFGDFKLRFNSLCLEAGWCIDIGELDRAEVLFRSAERFLDTESQGPEHVSFAVNLGEIAVARGQWQHAHECFTRAMAVPCASNRAVTADLVTAALGLTRVRLGQLSKARELEKKITTWEREWSWDPTLVIHFFCELRKLEGRPTEAADFARRAAESVAGRWAGIEIKLRLLEIAYAQRADKARALKAAEEVYERARELRLQRRVTEAEAWIRRLQ